MANTAAIAKKANTALVINAIRKSGAVTVDEIAAATQMSRPTVVSIFRDLENRRIVKKAGYAPAEVGRQPTLYDIDDTGYFAIGIDVDGPPVRLVLTDLKGTIRHAAQWEFENSATADQILDRLDLEIKQALRTCGLQTSSVLGVGLGLPASVDVHLNRAVNLSRLTALRGLPIADELERTTGIPTLVRNDAHLIALAEVVDSVHDYLYVIFRTGVGMALVIDSEVFEGETGNAGFIGHTTLDPNGPTCECGARGCLESLASKRAVAQNYLDATGQAATYQEVIDRAAGGEPAATIVIEQAGRWLGLAIGNLIKTLDIYEVVIGDLGCGTDHPFFRVLEQEVSASTTAFLRRRPVLRLGHVSGASFALGGAQSVIDQFLATPRLRLRAGTDAAG